MRKPLITGTNIGTVKSRVNRARRHLARLMGLEGADEGEGTGSGFYGGRGDQ